jgi:hypothetical protein
MILRYSDKRLCRCQIDPEVLGQLLTYNGLISISSNLPVDTIVVDIREDILKNCLIAFVESKNFDPVPPGSRIPELDSNMTPIMRYASLPGDDPGPKGESGDIYPSEYVKRLGRDEPDWAIDRAEGVHAC